MKKRKIMIDVGGTVKNIGFLEGEVFTTHRKESKHLYQKMDAWGIDVKAYDGMRQNEGMTTVRVVDKETGITYSTHVDNFMSYGSILHHKPHRAQVFLPRKYWSKTESQTMTKAVHETDGGKSESGLTGTTGTSGGTGE